MTVSKGSEKQVEAVRRIKQLAQELSGGQVAESLGLTVPEIEEFMEGGVEWSEQRYGEVEELWVRMGLDEEDAAGRLTGETVLLEGVAEVAELDSGDFEYEEEDDYEYEEEDDGRLDLEQDDADELRQALESGVELPVRARSWEEQLQRKRAAVSGVNG